MNIEVFVLCDAATEQQGKLNVLGAFDKIWTKKLPAVHMACAIAARIRFEKDEEGKHRVTINIIDEDDQSIGPRFEGDVNIRMGDDVVSAVTNIILNIQKLKLEKDGHYRIDLAIDGPKKSSLPFDVRKTAT